MPELTTSPTEVPLAAEILRSLKQLGIPLDHSELGLRVMQHPVCAAARRKLLKEESRPGQISGATISEVSEKYRFDVIVWEISSVAHQIVLSIGVSYLYLPYLAPANNPPYLPGIADLLFWHEIECGFRLASSAWDRVALLLDIVLGLDLGVRCNFNNVMGKINARKCSHSEPGTKLITFLDGDFRLLEGKQRGSGIRHESTHQMSVMTRYKMETLDSYVHGRDKDRLDPSAEHAKLVSQYRHYVEGVDNALALITAYTAYSSNYV